MAGMGFTGKLCRYPCTHTLSLSLSLSLKKMRISLIPFAFFIFYGSPMFAETELSVDLHTSNGLQIEALADSDGYELYTTNEDPYLTLHAEENKIRASHTTLSFEYFCPDGADFVEVFYRSSLDTAWGQERSLEGGALPKAEAWQPFSIDLKHFSKGKWQKNDRFFRLDLGRTPGLRLQVRNFALREQTEGEKLGIEEASAQLEAKSRQAAAVDQYLNTVYPAQINVVEVLAEKIIIRGTLNSRFPRKAGLIRFKPHEDPWKKNTGSLLVELTLEPEFSFVIPRFEGSRDRIADRFAFVALNDNELLCRASWANDVVGAATQEIPRLYPANKKGLAGVTFKEGIFEDDIEELGITASTINVPLGRIVVVGNNPIVYEHQGKKWHYNRATIQSFDKKIKWMTERNIVISAILLVDKYAGVLVHPDYNTAGIYSMGNMNSEVGTDAYRALVSFLAERYSRPDREHGWITHWVVFNEVDQGWIWTNMGDQPIQLYMDAYNKAMRLTWLEARRHNPTAEVFISLTHHWQYKPADAFRVYPPRTLLDRLALYSKAVGDYQWGVAYHPYPQSLLNSRTWEDGSVTASFDTPYITPKNIEVLDAYLHQSQFLYQGEPRTVLLSEQGFHTPDYSEASMRDQAAAIAYTWEKILPLETVESFHYHRWVDHPQEGGLKLGLRTLPETNKPYGDRKEPAFSVFSALETDAHEEAIAPLKEELGIKNWEEIRMPASKIY